MQGTMNQMSHSVGYKISSGISSLKMTDIKEGLDDKGVRVSNKSYFVICFFIFLILLGGSLLFQSVWLNFFMSPFSG
jgi:hypothetical protein